VVRERITTWILLPILTLAIADHAKAQANRAILKAQLRIDAAPFGHSDRLDQVSISANGKSIATAAIFTDPSLSVWNTADGARRFRLELGPDEDWSGIALSADGMKVAALVRKTTFEADATMFVWDVTTTHELLRLPLAIGNWKHSRYAIVAFAPDGNSLAVGGMDIKLIDLAAGKVRATLVPNRQGRGIWDIAFHPNGKLLMSAGRDIQFWDAVTGVQRGGLEAQDSVTAAFSPDGSRVAFNAEKTVVVRKLTVPVDASKPVELSPTQDLFTFPHWVEHLAFSADGANLLAVADNECREFELATGKLLIKWSHSGENVCGLMTLAGRPTAVTKQDNPRALGFWDIARNSEVFTGGGRQGPVSALTFGPGDMLISAADDLRFWNSHSGTLLARGQVDGRIAQLLMLSSGKEVVAVGAKVNWYSVPDAKKLRSFDPKPIPYGYLPVLFSEGRLIAVPRYEAVDRAKKGAEQPRLAFIDFWQQIGIAVIDVENGKEIRRLAAIVQPNLRVTSDGSTLAAFDYGVKFWDLREATILYESPLSHWVQALTFSSDGKLAAICQDETITIWNVVSRNPAKSWTISRDEFIAGKNISPGLAFSPDNRWLAIGTPRGSVQLWDVEEGRILADVRGHQSTVGCFAFRPDAKALASGSSDRSIVIWDLTGLAKSTKP
jgi:WD40 repeat protein